VNEPPPSKLSWPIPISATVDGIELSGEITFLQPNDMSVVMHSPVSGLGTGLHVPYFMMFQRFWLATYEVRNGTKVPVLTERGRERAADLLKELYDHARGRPSGWGVARIEPDGRWVDIELPPDFWREFGRRR